jgi:hypothetical protein
MSLTGKDTKRKIVKKRHLPDVVFVTKTTIPVSKISLPEKFDRMNEMLKRTTFLAS